MPLFLPSLPIWAILPSVFLFFCDILFPLIFFFTFRQTLPTSGFSQANGHASTPFKPLACSFHSSRTRELHYGSPIRYHSVPAPAGLFHHPLKHTFDILYKTLQPFFLQSLGTHFLNYYALLRCAVIRFISFFFFPLFPPPLASAPANSVLTPLNGGGFLLPTGPDSLICLIADFASMPITSGFIFFLVIVSSSPRFRGTVFPSCEKSPPRLLDFVVFSVPDQVCRDFAAPPIPKHSQGNSVSLAFR